MKPTTRPTTFRSIDAIATKASFWAAIASLVIVVIFAFVTVVEERQSNYESEKKRLGNIASSLSRSVAAEMLVGDSKSLSVVLSDYKKRYLLNDIAILDAPHTESRDWWNGILPPNQAEWSEKLPGVSPPRWVWLAVEPQAMEGRLSGLWSLIGVCVPLFFFGVFITFRIQRDLRRSIVLPIQQLARDPEKWRAEGRVVASEALTLHQHLLKYIKERDLERDTAERLRIEASIGEVAAQVAHDIRSPLAALDMVAAHLDQIPEEKRIIIRTALARIRDIANGLLDKHRKQSPALAGSLGKNDRRQTDETDSGGIELLSSLVDSLVTEKRLQFRSRWGVQIDAPLSTDGYGLFARVNGSDFKRVLSNLINNAVEAVGERGRVKVELGAADDMVVMRVRDDGPGIPAEILPRITQKGETYGKSGGSGLGLYFAKQKAEEWGGSLDIASAPGAGTVVEFRLPKSPVPAWFVSTLVLWGGGTVVVLDDDTTIHQIWEGRFESLQLRSHQIDFVHLSTAPEFSRFVLEHRGSEDHLYLVDYELIGSKRTGLDLIEELNIGKQSILVTSRFEEREIRRRATGLGIRMIPKSLAGFVPIHVVRKKVATSSLYGSPTTSIT